MKKRKLTESMEQVIKWLRKGDFIKECRYNNPPYQVVTKYRDAPVTLRTPTFNALLSAGLIAIHEEENALYAGTIARYWTLSTDGENIEL